MRLPDLSSHSSVCRLRVMREQGCHVSSTTPLCYGGKSNTGVNFCVRHRSASPSRPNLMLSARLAAEKEKKLRTLCKLKTNLADVHSKRAVVVQQWKTSKACQQWEEGKKKDEDDTGRLGAKNSLFFCTKKHVDSKGQSDKASAVAGGWGMSETTMQLFSAWKATLLILMLF